MSTNDTDELFALDITSSGREASRFAILPRPKNNPDFVRYTAPEAPSVVYIYRAAWYQMRDIALDAGRNEAIGLLLGRPCTDERGAYTLVMAVEAALPGEYVGMPGFVKISAAGKAALKARAAQKYPGLEDVGWFHTHPSGEPRFSQTDFEEQGTLLEHQVGIVAASECYQRGQGDPLGVYLGPVGDRLSGSVLPRQPKTMAPAPVEVAVPDDGRHARHRAPELLHRLPVGGIIAVAVLMLMQLGLASWVHGAIRAQPAAATAARAATVITRTRRVVRVVPALFTARRCAVGVRLSVPVRVSLARTSALRVTALNPAVASASYAAGNRELTISCLAYGTTTVELRDPSSRATAGLVVSVSSTNPHLNP